MAVENKEAAQSAETMRVVDGQVFEIRQLPDAKTKRITVDNVGNSGSPRFKREYKR